VSCHIKVGCIVYLTQNREVNINQKDTIMRSISKKSATQSAKLEKTLTRKIKAVSNEQKSARVMPGQISRPLVSMPYFTPIKGSMSDFTMLPSRFGSPRTTIKSAKTIYQAFDFYKNAWNKYVETCSDAARSFVSSPKDGERIITIVAAADDIRSMQQSYHDARKAAINLFVKIGKLRSKKNQLEWVRKSLGLEMIQILRLTSEKIVMDIYLSLRDLLTKKS
jgi:hypothetical protein